METQIQPKTEATGTYQPIGVPAQAAPKVSGMTQGVIGLVCAIISLLFFPPFFGIIGII